MPGPPSGVTRPAVSSIVSARSYSDRVDPVVRPVHTTVAPASPRAAAMPRPAPRVAPATTATRPRRAFRSADHAIPLVVSGIEQVAQAVAGEIEREREREDREPRPPRHPRRRLQELLGGVQHRAPTRRGRLDAQAEER